MPETIVPNSTVWLLHEVPLDSSYQHTIFFSTQGHSYVQSIEHQVNVFLDANRGWVKRVLTNQMYKRVNAGVLRVGINAEELYDINYMIFINDKVTPSKYFYAFVNLVEYVNERTTAIYYEIDVLQTWMFDYSLGECFVEREHTLTDHLFEHTLEEEIGVGETVLTEFPEPEVNSLYEENTTYKLFSDLGVFVVSGSRPYMRTALDTNYPDTAPQGCYSGTPVGSDPTFSVGFQRSTATSLHGVASGLFTQQFIMRKQQLASTYSNYDNLYWLLFRVESYLAAMGNDIENVMNIFQAPAAFWSRPVELNVKDYEYPPATEQAKGWQRDPVSHNIYFPIELTSFTYGEETYIPKNKKCFCYPYSFFLFTSSDGNSVIYKPELFDVGEIAPLLARFKVTGVINGDFECSLFPKYYDGLETNYTNRLSCFKTPVLGWTSDTFRAWLAQHKTTLIMDTAKTLGKIAATAGLSVISTAGAVEPAIFAANALASSGLTGDELRKAQRSALREIDEKQAAVTKSLQRSGVQIAESAFSSTTSSIAQMGEAMALPPGAHGGNTNLLDVGERIFGMRFYKGFAKPEYMKKIDDYFTRYGYAVKEIKFPNRNNRPYYTFLKTSACTILKHNMFAKSVSNFVKNQLMNIYNSGVTFWTDPDRVGDYTVDNSPA